MVEARSVNVKNTTTTTISSGPIRQIIVHLRLTLVLLSRISNVYMHNTVQEGGCRFMAAWVREEENASNQRQKKREAEEADNVEVARGVTVASLRRFRIALIGPTQGLPKRRRLCR